jgi:hypothetical protein
MKNDAIQCEKLLIQNSSSGQGDTADKAVKENNNNEVQFKFLEQMENDLDNQIRGLNDMKSKIENFKNQIKNGHQNNKHNNSEVVKKATQPPIQDDMMDLSSLMGINSSNKNTKVAEQQIAKAQTEAANTYNNDDQNKFLDMLRNETLDNKPKVNEKETEPKANNIGLSLGEIEKQIAMLKSLSIKN